MLANNALMNTDNRKTDLDRHGTAIQQALPAANKKTKGEPIKHREQL